MKEFILVEFLFEQQDAIKATDELAKLNDDFRMLETDPYWRTDGQLTTYDSKPWFRVTGKINSTTATAIKLSNAFLSDHMRISYIPEELKDRYRK
jgi:hypothetical protein